MHNGRSGGILLCGLNICGEKSCYIVRWSSLWCSRGTSSTLHIAFVGWNCGKFICLPSGMDNIRYKIYPQKTHTHARAHTHTHTHIHTHQATLQHRESCGLLTGVN